MKISIHYDVVVNQIVCGGERALVTHKIRCGNFIGSRLENFRESLIFRRFHGDLHHFPGGGVGRRRIQTGNVAELRADAAHLLDPVVHHFLSSVSSSFSSSPLRCTRLFLFSSSYSVAMIFTFRTNVLNLKNDSIMAKVVAVALGLLKIVASI